MSLTIGTELSSMAIALLFAAVNAYTSAMITGAGDPAQDDTAQDTAAVNPVFTAAGGESVRAHLLAAARRPCSPALPAPSVTPEQPAWHREMYGVTDGLGWPNTPRIAIKVPTSLRSRPSSATPVM